MHSFIANYYTFSQLSTLLQFDLKIKNAIANQYRNINIKSPKTKVTKVKMNHKEASRIP